MKLLTATANTANITTDYWQVVGSSDASTALSDLTKFAVGTINDNTGQIHFAQAEDITRFLTGQTYATFPTNGGTVLSSADGFPTTAGQVYGDNFVYVNDVSNFTSGDSLAVLEGIKSGLVPYSADATSTDGFVSEFDTVGAIGLIPTASVDLHTALFESAVMVPTNNASAGIPAVILQPNADFNGTNSSDFFQNIANPPTPTNLSAGNATNAYFIACSGDAQSLSNATEIFTDLATVTVTGLVGLTPSKTITAVSDVSKLTVGQVITGAGIPLGTHIASINSSGSSITLSQQTIPSSLNGSATSMTIAGAEIASISVGANATVITLSSGAPGGQFNVGQTVSTVFYISTPNGYQPMAWYGGNIISSAVIGGTTYTTSGNTVVTDLKTTSAQNYKIPVTSMTFPYTGTFTVAGKTGTNSAGTFTIGAGSEFKPTAYAPGFPLGGMKFTSPTGKASSFSFVGTATSGSTTITVNSGGTGVTKNQLVNGGGIPAGTYITSVSGTTITISQPTTSALTSESVTTYTSVFSNDGSIVYLTNPVTSGETGTFTFGYTILSATAFATTVAGKTAKINTAAGASFDITTPLSPYIYSDGINNPVNGTFLVIPSVITGFGAGLVGTVTSISANTFFGNYVTDGYVASGSSASAGSNPRIINASQYSSIAGLTNPPVVDANDPTLFGPVSNVSVQAQVANPASSPAITGEILLPSVTGGAGSLPSNIVPGMAVTGNYVPSGTLVGNPAFVNPPYEFTGVYSATTGSQTIETITAPWFQNTDGSYATVLATGSFSNSGQANTVSEFSGYLTSGSAVITVTSSITAFSPTPTSNGYIGYALQGTNIPTGALIGSVTLSGSGVGGTISMVDASGNPILSTTNYTGQFGASSPVTLLGAEPDVISSGSSYGYVRATYNQEPFLHGSVFNSINPAPSGTWQITTTATGTNGSKTMTVASATGIQVGMFVQGTSNESAFGASNYYYVTNVSGTTITLNQPLTAALSSTSVQFTDTGYWGTQTGVGNSPAISTTSEIIPSVISLTVAPDGVSSTAPALVVTLTPGSPLLTIISGSITTSQSFSDPTGTYWPANVPQAVLFVSGSTLIANTAPMLPNTAAHSWFAAITNTNLDITGTSVVNMGLGSSSGIVPSVGDIVSDYLSGVTSRSGLQATYSGEILTGGTAIVTAVTPTYAPGQTTTSTFTANVYSTSNGATSDNYTLLTSTALSQSYVGASLSGNGIGSGAKILSITNPTNGVYNIQMDTASTVPDTQNVVVNLTKGSKVANIVSGSVSEVVPQSSANGLSAVTNSTGGGGLVSAGAYVTAKSGNGAGATITFSQAATGTVANTTLTIVTRYIAESITASYSTGQGAQNGYAVTLYNPQWDAVNYPIDGGVNGSALITSSYIGSTSIVGAPVIFWDYKLSPVSNVSLTPSGEIGVTQLASSPFASQGAIAVGDAGIGVTIGGGYTGTQIDTYGNLAIEYSNQTYLAPTYSVSASLTSSAGYFSNKPWVFNSGVTASGSTATFSLPNGYGPDGQSLYDIVGTGTPFALPNVFQITAGTGGYYSVGQHITVGSGSSAETFVVGEIFSGASGGDVIVCESNVTTMQPSTAGQTTWNSGTTTFNVGSSTSFFSPASGEDLYVVIVDYNPTTLAPNTPEVYKVSSFSASGSTFSVTLATGLSTSKSVASFSFSGSSYTINPTVYVGYPVFHHASGFQISAGGTNGITRPGDQSIWLNTNVINGRPLIQPGDVLTIQGSSTTPPTWIDSTENPSVTLTQNNGVESVTVQSVVSDFHPNEVTVHGNVSGKTITLTTPPTGSSGYLPVASVTKVYVGYTVTGTNIPSGTTITSISGTTVTLSQLATASSTGVDFTFIQPSPAIQLCYVTFTTPLLNYHAPGASILLPPQGSQEWQGVTFQDDGNAWGLNGSKVVGVLAPYSGFEINGLPAESGVYLNAIAKASTTEVDGTRSAGFITGDYGTWLKLSNGQFVHGMILSGSTTVGTNPINASESIFLPGFFDNLAQNVTPVDALGETVNGGYTFEPYVYTGSYAVAGSAATHNLTNLTVSPVSPGFTIPSSGWIVTDSSSYLPLSPAAVVASVTGGTSESTYTSGVEPSLITLSSSGQLPTPQSFTTVANQTSQGTSITVASNPAVDSNGDLSIITGMAVSGLGVLSGTFVSAVSGTTITLSKSTTLRLQNDTLSFNGVPLTMTATSQNFGINITNPVVVPQGSPGSLWPTTVTFNTFASNIDTVNNVIYLSNTALGGETPIGSFSASYSAGSATITANSLPSDSSSASGFVANNSIVGPGIPNNTTIVAVNGTSVPITLTLSSPVTQTVSNGMCVTGGSSAIPETFASQVTPEITMDSTSKMALLVDKGINQFVYQNTIFMVSPSDIDGETVVINTATNTLQKPVGGYVGGNSNFPLSGVYVWEGSIGTESAVDVTAGTTSGSGVITRSNPFLYNHSANTVVASYQSGDRYFGSTNVGDLESVTPTVVGSLYGTTLNTPVIAGTSDSIVVNPPPTSSTVTDSSGNIWQTVANLDLSVSGGIVIIGSGDTQEAVLLSGVSQRVDGATSIKPNYYPAVPVKWTLAPNQTFTYSHSAGEPVCVPNLTAGIFTTSEAWGALGSLSVPTVLAQVTTAGATSISVVSPAGISIGDNLYISDGLLSEYVQVAQSWNGSSVIPLTSGTENAHGGQSNPAIVTPGALAISAGEFAMSGSSVTNGSTTVTLSGTGSNTTANLSVGMPVTSSALLGTVTATGNISTHNGTPNASLNTLTNITGGAIAIGMVVTGTNIPAGTVVTNVFSQQGTPTVTLNQIPSGTGTGITFTFTPAATNNVLTIASITDSTHFTLSSNWPGATSSSTTLLIGDPVDWYVNSSLSGTGMPSGVYITNINGQVVTLSNFTTNVGFSGTATASSTTTLTDSSATWTTNQWAGSFINAGSSTAVIVSNTATVLTVASWTGGTPSSTASFSITNVATSLISYPAVVLNHNAVNVPTNITASDAFPVGATLSPITANGIVAGSTIEAVAFQPGNVILNLSEPSALQVVKFSIGNGFVNSHAKGAPILGSAHTGINDPAIVASNATGADTVNASAEVGMTLPWYAPGSAGSPTVNTSVASSVESNSSEIAVASPAGFPTMFPTIYQFNSILPPELGRVMGNILLGTTTIPYVKTGILPTSAPFAIKLCDDNVIVSSTSVDSSGNNVLILASPTDDTYPDMTAIQLASFDTNTSYAKIDVPNFYLGGIIYNCSTTAGSNVIKVPKTTLLAVGQAISGYALPSTIGGNFIGAVDGINSMVTIVDSTNNPVYSTATTTATPVTFGSGDIFAGQYVSNLYTTPLPSIIPSGSIVTLMYGGNQQNFVVSSTGNLNASDAISGNGIPLGTTIASVNALTGSIVMSASATASGNQTITDFTQGIFFQGNTTSGSTVVTDVVTICMPGDVNVPVQPTSAHYNFPASQGSNGVFTSVNTVCVVGLNENLSAGDVIMVSENGVSQALTVANHTDTHSTFIPVKPFTPLYAFDDNAVSVTINGNVQEGSPIVSFASSADWLTWNNAMLLNITDATGYAINCGNGSLFSGTPIITDFVCNEQATVSTTASSAAGSQSLTIATPPATAWIGQYIISAMPTVSLTASSSTVVVPTAVGITQGMQVWGSGIIAGTTVENVVGTTLTLSKPAIFSTSGSTLFISAFPYETQVVDINGTTLLANAPALLPIVNGQTFILYGVSGLVLSSNALDTTTTATTFSLGNVSFVKPYGLSVGSGATQETIYPTTAPVQSGSNWVLGLFSPTKYAHSLGEIVSYSETPSNPAPGDIAFNPSIGKFQMFDGNTWRTSRINSVQPQYSVEVTS